jgi:hypothetical protein
MAVTRRYPIIRYARRDQMALKNQNVRVRPEHRNLRVLQALLLNVLLQLHNLLVIVQPQVTK